MPAFYPAAVRRAAAGSRGRPGTRKLLRSRRGTRNPFGKPWRRGTRAGYGRDQRPSRARRGTGPHSKEITAESRRLELAFSGSAPSVPRRGLRRQRRAARGGGIPAGGGRAREEFSRSACCRSGRRRSWRATVDEARAAARCVSGTTRAGEALPRVPAGGFRSEEEIAVLPAARRIDVLTAVPGSAGRVRVLSWHHAAQSLSHTPALSCSLRFFLSSPNLA